MAQQYNAPTSTPAGTASNIGPQINDHFYQKKAIIDLAKEQYFSPLANTTAMPKNMGKKISVFHYIPLLDDRNINSQGIDAAGVVIDSAKDTLFLPGSVKFTVEADATAAAAAVNAVSAGKATKTGAASPWTVTFSATSVTGADALVATALAAVPGATVDRQSGNLYGSSKDVGTITGKLPTLTESGGRVNRVGFTRKQIDGTLAKFGFFEEYTQESMDFDTDSELVMHINREMLRGANEMTEDALQVDLLNGAGTLRYTGSATSKATVASTSVLTYKDLMHLSIDLDNNRTPKNTTVIKGSRMVDTRTIPGARYAFIGSELIPTFKAMTDLHDNPAFIGVEKYADAGTAQPGEIGAVDQLRLIVVPEMAKWAGGGADASASPDFYQTFGKFDVFPLLVVGDASFTTIGFQTDGKSSKFRIFNKAPGEQTADRNDPFGEMGFMSIKWYYGFMALRPERIGLILTAAKL